MTIKAKICQIMMIASLAMASGALAQEAPPLPLTDWHEKTDPKLTAAQRECTRQYRGNGGAYPADVKVACTSINAEVGRINDAELKRLKASSDAIIKEYRKK